MPHPVFLAIAWFLVAAAGMWRAVAKGESRALLIAAGFLALGIITLIRK
jgi:hypothetical protein